MPGIEGNGRWRPTKSAKYGVVVYGYEPQKATYPFLRLQFGDVVQILEENGGWYRGFSLRDKHSKGIFPASHVHLKDCTVRNPGPDEAVVSKEEPIVQEISDVLREWSVVWKRLYAEGRRRQFQELTQLMRDLLDRRRQILSKTLPRDELKELKQLVGTKIDHGNRMLNMDLVARDENGAPLDPKKAGVMHLYKTMKAWSQQQGNEPRTRTSIIQFSTTTPVVPKRDEHHLFLKFSALALPMSEPCELQFFIYDARQSKALSERYMIALSQHCLPKDPEKINQCFAVFTDLDSSDVQNKELYLACQVIRVGNDLEGKRTAMPLRKPHGAAVVPLHQIINSKHSDQEERDVQMEVYICPPQEFHKLLDSIIRKQGIFHPTEKGTGVFISLKPLLGPLEKVKEENPLLFRKFTAECQKLGFPEIIRPYDIRHDVYLTLSQGVFNKGTKRADKNVQVDVEVLDDKDQVIQDCISPGTGEPDITTYHSLVQYHMANPVFQETIKMSVPASAMPSCHVRFSMYHKSTIISSKVGRSEPFAISHLRLMKEDDTALQDGTYELFVYKYKETCRGAYRYTTLPCINDPTTPQIVSPDLLSPRDSFSVRTQICSTSITQNVDLHGLLHWRQNIPRLPAILTAVTKVAGDEIVKFLADTFNALFAIMEERGDEFGNLVFEALVFIIGLLAVEKYENFRPVLDTYCDKLFNAASVHTHLVAKMKHVFEQVMLVDGSRKMRGDIIQKTFKAAEFLIKFIMKSRVLYERATRGKNSEQFLQSLRDLLQTTCNMMRLECPENELIAPRAQAQALQFFPQTFDLFLTVMSVKTLGDIVADFLNNLKETKLKIYKSVFVSAVVSSELFRQKESRVVILPAILRHLRYHIKNRDDLLDKSLEAMGSILMMLHDQELSAVDEEIRVMVWEMLQVLLDCFTQLTGRNEKVSSVVGHCVAVLMQLLELMTPRHYQIFRQTFTDAAGLEEFILCAFNAFCELVALNALYHNDWTSLKLLQCYVTLRATTQLSQILVEDFLGVDHDPIFFNPTLWQNFFQVAVAFTCQPTLQLESLGEIKRSRILDNYGDMRVAMNALMIAKWHALGNYQSRYVPSMIGPFLKVSLIPHTTIRRGTIPLFFDMMESEFRYRKNFHMMETEMIDKLDVFISGGMGDAKYRLVLHRMLSERCKSNPQMEREGGMAFIESLAELLRRLLDYRTVHQGDDFRDLHMHVMFNLLNFYKEMGREEIYIRYIYHLAELHKASGNWVEAASTLLLHAQLLQWSAAMQKQEGPYPRQSSAERKEQLYKDIIDFYDKGKLWECGIKQCKEIASQLESVTFNYEKLSEIHQTIARFYSNIMREIRAESEYFRVGFYGGFPPFLKNKVFIFRGQEYERLSDFNARMLTQFPNAKQMKSLEPPGLDILEHSDQYIQSCSVEPLPEKDNRFEGKNVAEQIARYYHTNEIRRFMLKRPFHRGQKDKENEYKTLHTECTVYTTGHKFPGILRWFEVVDTEVRVLTPVENGIEMVLDNVQQLRTVINRIRADSAQSTKPLTMKLNGTLDAAVNGGVSKFEVFFTHDYLEQNPKCKQSVPKLKMLMEELCKILEEGVALHARVRPESMKGLHQRMEELLGDYSTRYGGGAGVRGGGTYDAVTFHGGLDVVDTSKRRLSSSRRKLSTQQSAGSGPERAMTVTAIGGVAGRRPPSIHESGSESGSPVLSRDRAHTEFPRLPNLDSSGRDRDYDEVARLPQRVWPTRTTSPSSSPANPPSVPARRTTTTTPTNEEPPPPPLRRNISGSSHSAHTSHLVAAPPTAPPGADDFPPPMVPPRSSSVRHHHRHSGSSFGSKESLESSASSTPQEGTPVTSHRDISAQLTSSGGVNGSDSGVSEGGVKAMAARLEAKDEERPPVPIKKNRQHGLELGPAPVVLKPGDETAA